jgi:hypothetical protein
VQDRLNSEQEILDRLKERLDTLDSKKGLNSKQEWWDRSLCGSNISSLVLKPPAIYTKLQLSPRIFQTFEMAPME